jgi:hypothetical protein
MTMLSRIVCVTLLLALAGCAGTADETDVSAAAADPVSADTGVTEVGTAPGLEGEPCPELRPTICTLHYAPVCGIGDDGFRRDYGNFCGACGDARVLTVIEGTCPETTD